MGQEDGQLHIEWLHACRCSGHYHVLRLVLQLKYQAESEDSQTCNTEWGSLPVTLPSN